jgi:hypothetical protein
LAVGGRLLDAAEESLRYLEVVLGLLQMSGMGYSHPLD